MRATRRSKLQRSAYHVQDTADQRPTGGEATDVHPLLQVLIRMIPPADSKWSLDEQARWMRAFDAATALVFKSSELIKITVRETDGEISITRGDTPESSDG